MKVNQWLESRQGDGTGGSLGSILLREEPADYPGRVVVEILGSEILHLRQIHFTTQDLRNEEVKSVHVQLHILPISCLDPQTIPALGEC